MPYGTFRDSRRTALDFDSLLTKQSGRGVNQECLTNAEFIGHLTSHEALLLALSPIDYGYPFLIELGVR